MITAEERQEWQDLAEGLRRNYQDAAAEAITALLADVDRLEQHNEFLMTQYQAGWDSACAMARAMGYDADALKLTAERDAALAELATVRKQIEAREKYMNPHVLKALKEGRLYG